jgi:hypothetical protein
MGGTGGSMQSQERTDRLHVAKLLAEVRDEKPDRSLGRVAGRQVQRWRDVTSGRRGRRR